MNEDGRTRVSELSKRFYIVDNRNTIVSFKQTVLDVKARWCPFQDVQCPPGGNGGSGGGESYNSSYSMQTPQRRVVHCSVRGGEGVQFKQIFAYISMFPDVSSVFCCVLSFPGHSQKTSPSASQTAVCLDVPVDQTYSVVRKSVDFCRPFQTKANDLLRIMRQPDAVPEPLWNALAGFVSYRTQQNIVSRGNSFYAVSSVRYELSAC